MRRILFSLLVFIPVTALAEGGQVYKIEHDGKVEFSTTPPSLNATPAKLPKLGHWKIENSKGADLTCDAHGGINCALGADTDGSVVCLDNFKNSEQRFNFECTAAKLSILQVSDPAADGRFKITIRNGKAVTAKKTSVQFKPEHMGDSAKLVGPETIDGFGIGEYEYRPDGKLTVNSKPKLSQFIVACENCD